MHIEAGGVDVATELVAELDADVGLVGRLVAGESACRGTPRMSDPPTRRSLAANDGEIFFSRGAKARMNAKLGSKTSAS